jgi:hypothetical protein
MLFLFYSKCIIHTITHFFKKMSFNNKFAINNNIMSVKRFDEIDAQFKALVSDNQNGRMYTNLNVYIPRIDSRYSEENVKQNFQALGIGIVKFVDFVSTKYEETKEIKFVSAFLTLFEWNKNSPTFIEFQRAQQAKLYITNSEYWFLFPAKNMITRSKVNTSQLATYMDELFERVDSIENDIEKNSENITVSVTHFNNLLAKSEEQDAQIKYLLNIVAEQTTQLAHINNYLLKKEDYQEQLPEKKRSLTIEDNNFEPELAPPSPVVTPPQNKSPVYYEDECFFLKPLVITKNNSNSKLDIESCSFSFNIDDVLGPVAKSMGLTKEEAREGIQREVSNCSRAKNSNNFCGNA